MRDKIVAQSIRLFEQKGFSQTSIQDIVDALKVTKGTFYYYFSSKEQLLMEIHLAYIDDLLRRQAAIMAERSTTFKEKLHQNVYLLIGDIQEKGPSGRVFFREMRHLSPENAADIREKRTTFRKNIEQIVSEGIRRGEFRENLQAQMVAFAILGMTNWSYQWFDPHGGVTAEELTHIFMTMILQGITPFAEVAEGAEITPDC
ncbi:TetR/AcrR family transcriptional regulator [Numidum massiliense]|uniref:TetR/AcrR family transcriptional regulator n=1 Tax=Numidum massiliense TaxID=1522315 RepID=UPI0006D56601|nr:TetR/AcrR family transcriptional regulator [Numidum massiliense]